MSKRMRPVSRDEGFQKLRSLRCFQEVYERLLAGWGAPELARFIQEDRTEYGHASRISLVQVLQRFRNTIPPAQFAAQRMPGEIHKAVEEVDEGIDALKELEKLYKIQMERINLDLANERQIKTTLPKMTQEMRVAKEILGGITDLRMDLGLNQRHLGESSVAVTVQVDVAKYGKESVQRVMADPEKRRKVFNMFERIVALPSRTEKAEAELPVIDAESEELELAVSEEVPEQEDEP